MTGQVIYRLDCGIAAIPLDDGKANVVSENMIRDIVAALDRAEADPSVCSSTTRTNCARP